MLAGKLSLEGWGVVNQNLARDFHVCDNATSDIAFAIGSKEAVILVTLSGLVETKGKVAFRIDSNVARRLGR